MNLFDGLKGLNLGGDLTFQWLNFKYSYILLNFKLYFWLGIIFVNSDKNHLINVDKKRCKINKMWTKKSLKNIC